MLLGPGPHHISCFGLGARLGQCEPAAVQFDGPTERSFDELPRRRGLNDLTTSGSSGLGRFGQEGLFLVWATSRPSNPLIRFYV